MVSLASAVFNLPGGWVNDIPHTIPERRAGRHGRPPGCDAAVYARRNVVGRYVNRLQQCQGRAMVVIAALMLWSMTWITGGGIGGIYSFTVD